MKHAMIFPGQGSQSVGMLSDLANEFESVEACFADASLVLGYDLFSVVKEGPEEQLNSTEVTQPALLAAGIATWQVWNALGGPDPKLMAGHSLGEYTALVAAGALSFSDAIALVRHRGQLMQAAVKPGEGSMAAILGLEDEQVISVCQQAETAGIVSAANFNSPGQVVIAGEKAAVSQAIELAQAAGARRAIELAVSVPSHCALMKTAAEGLWNTLSATEVREPRIPVVHNVNASANEDAQSIREALVEQLHSPVRWTESVRTMIDDGCELFFECGPGKVLAGLGRRIDRATPATPLLDRAGIESAIEAVS